MKQFVLRHKRPLVVWTCLAAGSLIVCILLWVLFIPREPVLEWAWVTLKLMLALGAPIGGWIAWREFGWLETSERERIAALDRRR